MNIEYNHCSTIEIVDGNTVYGLFRSEITDYNLAPAESIQLVLVRYTRMYMEFSGGVYLC